MENNMNHHYNLTMRTLSPLHIGGAQEKHMAQGLDYVSYRGRIYIIDLKKLCEHPRTNHSEVANYLIQEGGLLKCIEINKIDIEEVSSARYSDKVESEIKAFVKNGASGKPYVPGSSVKGAIRALVAANFGKPNKNDSNILGSFASDVFRQIKVVDGQAERIEYQNAKVFNLFQPYNEKEWVGGWKHELRNGNKKHFDTQGFVFTYECLPIGTDISLPLKITRSDSNWLPKLKEWDLKQQIDPKGTPLKPAFDRLINADPLSSLFRILNEKTKSYIEREIAFFQKYKVAEAALIISAYQKVLQLIPEDHSYAVFRMAHGSGFHSMTGDYQYTDHDVKDVWKGTRDRPHRHEGKKKYKSRKLIFNQDSNGLRFSPMGFVMWGDKASFPTDSEVVASNAGNITIIEDKPIVEIKPGFHKGIIKERVDLDAVIVVSGKPNKIDVYLQQDVIIRMDLPGYASPLPEGTVIRVTVTQVDKATGKPKMIKFSMLKR